MTSRLQKLCRKVNWFKGYIVRPILEHRIDEMEFSDESVRLIFEYNELCEKIRNSVTKDYEEKRTKIKQQESKKKEEK